MRHEGGAYEITLPTTTSDVSLSDHPRPFRDLLSVHNKGTKLCTEGCETEGELLRVLNKKPQDFIRLVHEWVKYLLL